MAQAEFLDPPMPDILQQWRFYLSVLSPRHGDHVVDVGCNTGDAERLLVRDCPSIGRIVGVEKSPSRHEQAIARCRNDGKPGQIEFRLADGQRLPFDESFFDRALCVETLEWIEDPVLALRELRRVLKPGAIGVIVHSDFDTQVFRTTDKVLDRRIVQAFADCGPHGRLGREIYGLCAQVGFSSVEPVVYALVNTDWRPNLYSYRVVDLMTDWLTKMAMIPEADIKRWRSDLEAQVSQGGFFYSINRYVCRCVK